MRGKLIHTAILLLFTLRLAAQFNLPGEWEGNYCSHLKSASESLKEYYAPVVSHPPTDGYDVHFYFLDIAAESNTVFISGNVTIGATVSAVVMDTFAFDLSAALVLDSVVFNGVRQPCWQQGEQGMVFLEEPMSSGAAFSARIHYHGLPATGGFFSGISTAYDTLWGQHVTWTLSEPYAAKDWFPVKQDLNDKADSVWVFVTTSAENMVGSQGLLTGVTAMPGGKARYEWKSRYPIAYYLISISVADYQDYSIWAHPANMEDSVLVQNFVYDTPECLNQWKGAIDQTTEFIELFSQIYGPYPFGEEKYGHCLSRIGGGMEHQTMTTLGGFNFGLVAHELGHSWFGDLVTCSSWNDIWVNEGFATYSDYLAHHFLASSFYDSLWLKIRHDHVKSKPDGSVYVPDSLLEDVWRVFDGRLSYSKGALLLHMIRFELQDDAMFFYILTSFAGRHAFSTASTMDFKDILEEISGKDFGDFFEQWYYGEGYPVFDINWWQPGDTLRITSFQSGSAAATPLFRMHVPYVVHFTDGTDSSLVLYQDGNISNYHLHTEKAVESLEVDPDQWILHKVNSLRMDVETPENPLWFSLGPNPTSGPVRLCLKERTFAARELTVSDMTGRVMLTRQIGEDMTLDMSAWEDGIYLVRISDGKVSCTKRVVKIK